jgi:hypothetical protein
VDDPNLLADSANRCTQPDSSGHSRQQRELTFFMKRAADCALEAEQHGSSLGALGLRRLAAGYLSIASRFNDEGAALPLPALEAAVERPSPVQAPTPERNAA